MVLSAILTIVLSLAILIPFLYLLTNLLMFIGNLFYSEIQVYRSEGSFSEIEFNELEWGTILEYNPSYFLIYLGVGIYAMVRFTLWAYHLVKTSIRETRDKLRKEKEREIAREHNHKRKLLEYRKEINEFEDKQTENNLPEPSYEDVGQDEEVESFLEEQENEQPVEEIKKVRPRKVVRKKARKRSEVVKDVHGNEDDNKEQEDENTQQNEKVSPETEKEDKMKRMLREREERKRRNELRRKTEEQTRRKREKMRSKMDSNFENSVRDSDDEDEFNIKGVFNRKDG